MLALALPLLLLSQSNAYAEVSQAKHSDDHYTSISRELLGDEQSNGAGNSVTVPVVGKLDSRFLLMASKLSERFKPAINPVTLNFSAQSVFTATPMLAFSAECSTSCQMSTIC